MFFLIRRALHLVVVLFALYAFVKVPIGRRTGLEHLVAIFSSEPAQQAAVDLQSAGADLKNTLLTEARALEIHAADAGLPMKPSKSARKP